MDDDWQQKVRERAYTIWEREGRPEGGAEQRWDQAEEELRAEGHDRAEAPAAPDTPADTPERPGLGPVSDQGTNREPPPNEPPSWTSEDEPQPTTDEPGMD
jgi:hypothetical protein